MASIYVDHVFGKKNLSVGFLNIGTEEKKGNEVSQAAFKLMKNNLPEFYGNIEGRDILRGKVDIIVCDGFVSCPFNCGLILGTI